MLENLLSRLQGVNLKWILIVLVVCVVCGLITKAKGKSSKKKTTTTTTHRTHPPQTRTTTTTAWRPQTQTSTRTNSRTITKQNFSTKLRTLSDAQDERVQMPSAQKKLVTEARTYNTTRRKTFRASHSQETINVDLSWSENLAELLEATEVVYTNAELNCNRRLVSERFDYYINLHYRSFTAADLCHAKLKEIQPYEVQLRQLIARLRDRSDPLRVDKATYDQLTTLRKTMGDICSLLSNRRDTLNAQTKKIKFKIRDECGQRGQNWFDRLEERIRQNASN